jgi:hypothetical protein
VARTPSPAYGGLHELEFLIRVFGWLAVVALFLGLRVMWQTWTAKRCKWISTYHAGEGARPQRFRDGENRPKRI